MATDACGDCTLCGAHIRSCTDTEEWRPDERHTCDLLPLTRKQEARGWLVRSSGDVARALVVAAGIQVVPVAVIKHTNLHANDARKSETRLVGPRAKVEMVCSLYQLWRDYDVTRLAELGQALKYASVEDDPELCDAIAVVVSLHADQPILAGKAVLALMHDAGHLLGVEA